MKLAAALFVLLSACATTAPESTEGYILDVAPMSLHCALRGKILAFVGVDTAGNIQAGACANLPGGRQS